MLSAMFVLACHLIMPGIAECGEKVSSQVPAVTSPPKTEVFYFIFDLLIGHIFLFTFSRR